MQHWLLLYWLYDFLRNKELAAGVKYKINIPNDRNEQTVDQCG